MNEERTLAHAVAMFEPAEDVTDLDTARRLITCLRQKVSQIAAEAEPIEGEFGVFLGPDHERILHVLYDKHHLFPFDPDDSYWLDPPDLDEAFTDFIQAWLDVAWDMARDDADDPAPGKVVRSA